MNVRKRKGSNFLLLEASWSLKGFDKRKYPAGTVVQDEGMTLSVEIYRQSPFRATAENANCPAIGSIYTYTIAHSASRTIVASYPIENQAFDSIERYFSVRRELKPRFYLNQRRPKAWGCDMRAEKGRLFHSFRKRIDSRNSVLRKQLQF